jgi:CheY-like chemotaxis protein
MSDLHTKTYNALVVDDSEDDEKLLEFAFQSVKRLRLVGRVPDGEQAIRYLKGEGQFGDRTQHPFPDLLLLDLRMPRVDGFEVLSWLSTQNFPCLRVVILSGSGFTGDVQKALELGAHFYHTKELQMTEQCRMLEGLERQFLMSLGSPDAE